MPICLNSSFYFFILRIHYKFHDKRFEFHMVFRIIKKRFKCNFNPLPFKTCDFDPSIKKIAILIPNLNISGQNCQFFEAKFAISLR